MKRVVAGFISIIAVVALCAVMSACSTGFAGTYKFSKMSMSQGGMSIEIKAGESYMGVTVNEDAYTLEIKEDNTFVLKANMGEEFTEEGTWSEKDGKYYLSVDGEEIEAALNGNVLVFEMDGARLELKK